MKNKKLAEICKKARNNFFDFCQIVTKEDGYQFAAFHKLICDRIDHELKNTPEGIREMFSVPPGYGKSTILSQLLPAYLLGKDPSNKIILISYASDLSKRNAKLAKAIMDKPIYKLIFPETSIMGDNVNPPFDTAQFGGIRSMGREGSITGFRADFVLIDDILKGPREAGSDTIIRDLHEWYPTVPSTRMTPGGGIIILATRWTKKDLIGHLYEHDSRGRWNYINLEALCTDKEKDPLHREVGEPLWPEYKTLDSILEARELNERSFQVVYQGNCTASENTAIDIRKIQYTSQIPDYPYTVISYDTASKISVRSDYTAITIWKVNKEINKAVLIRLIREKFQFNTLLEKYKELDTIYRPNLTLIEDANSGTQLLQLNPDPHVLGRKAFKNVEEKFSLGELFDLKLAEAKIHFLSDISTQREALEELDEFPFGSHDDVALSVIHFLSWFIEDTASTNQLVRRGRKTDLTNLTKKVQKLGNKRRKERQTNLPFRSTLK